VAPGYWCRGAHSDQAMIAYRYPRHPACQPVPDDLPDEEKALVESLPDRAAAEASVMQRMEGCPAVIPAVKHVFVDDSSVWVAVEPIPSGACSISHLRDGGEERGEDALAPIAREVVIQIADIDRRGVLLLKLTLDDIMAVETSLPGGKGKALRHAIRLPLGATCTRDDPSRLKTLLPSVLDDASAPELLGASESNGLIDTDHKKCASWTAGVTIAELVLGDRAGLTHLLAVDNGQLKPTFRRLAGEKGASVSGQLLDLLSQLLQHDPHKRLSIEQALSHPWLEEAGGQIPST